MNFDYPHPNLLLSPSLPCPHPCLFLTFMSFCFVWWPTEFNWGCLCGLGFGTVQGSLVDSPVGTHFYFLVLYVHSLDWPVMWMKHSLLAFVRCAPRCSEFRVLNGIWFWVGFSPCRCALFCPQTSIKEGQLLKQTSSFQRWKKRYFKLRGRTLYYAKDSKVTPRDGSQALCVMTRSKPRSKPHLSWILVIA